MTWIESRVVEGIAKFGIKAVFIDHLHYLFDLSKIKSPSLELGAVVRSLKLLANRRGVMVFLVAHIGKKDSKEQVTIDHIRDSSFVSQEADYVLMLQRKATVDFDGNRNYENETALKVEKNRRNGRLGRVMVQLIDNKFVEVSCDVEPE
jgi:replicative DNA helicase